MPRPDFVPQRAPLVSSCFQTARPIPMIAQEFETAEDRAIQKLTESPFLRTWRKAFSLATGLEVELVAADPDGRQLPRHPHRQCILPCTPARTRDAALVRPCVNRSGAMRLSGRRVASVLPG